MFGIQVYTDADPSSGLSFVFHFDHLDHFPRLFIWKPKSTLKNKPWHSSPLFVAVQLMHGANEVHCEYVPDQEALTEVAQHLKRNGAHESFWWSESEDWWIETLQSDYFFPKYN